MDVQAERNVLPDVFGGGDGEPDVRDGLRRGQDAAGAVLAAEEQPDFAIDDGADPLVVGRLGNVHNSHASAAGAGLD